MIMRNHISDWGTNSRGWKPSRETTGNNFGIHISTTRGENVCIQKYISLENDPTNVQKKILARMLIIL